MKLGNSSQTVIPVPNFYYNRSLFDRETFHYSTQRNYFREKDLFSKTRDMNFSNNQRNHHRKFEEFNQTKYIPFHLSAKTEGFLREDHALRKIISFEDKERTFKPIEDIKNVTNFLQKTNTMSYTNPELREEIRGNIGGLLDRINSNLSTKKFDESDTKAIYHKTIEISYSPITSFNQSNESESSKFKNILKMKLQSMSTINQDAKYKALKKLDQEYSSEVYNLSNAYLPLLNKKIKIEEETKLNTLNKVDSLNDKEVDYLSSTRREYADYKGEKISYRRKLKEVSTINFDKYNSNKSRAIYSDNSRTSENHFTADSGLDNHSNTKKTFY